MPQQQNDKHTLSISNIPLKDTLFAQDIGKQFEFDEQVANVFDDMIERSIPYYKDTLKLIVDFICTHLQSMEENFYSAKTPDDMPLESQAKASHKHHAHKKMPIVYDLGSSTGTMLLSLSHTLSHQKSPLAQLIGIDNSVAMTNKAQLKAQAYGADISFMCSDILDCDLKPCEVVIATYILQFIRPLKRANLLKKIYESLLPGGILLFSEKMSSSHRILDRQMIEYYMHYKRKQGYTQGEISKKREALENVLIPFSLEENIAMLKEVGFSGVEVLFKWVNFGTIIAKK